MKDRSRGMMNLCYEYQHSMMLGSEVIRTNKLRMQDAKSVSTRQTRHVGGDVVVVEGRRKCEEALWVVLAAWELSLTSC